MASLSFPELIYLEEYGGDFQLYFEGVYEIFELHFVKGNPKFQGVNVYAQKKPLVDDKIHKTFYHITHEGYDENDRTPDVRRMERIRFPKFEIESSPHAELLIWENSRGRDKRILIYNEDESYLCVLTKRKNFYLFWTAYIVESNHRKRKLITEYKKYIKTKTA